MNKWTFFSHFWRHRSSRSRSQQILVSGENPQLVFTDHYLHAASSHGGRGEATLWDLLEGHQSHSWDLYPRDLITSPKSSMQIPSHWGLGYNTWVWGGNRRSVYSSYIQNSLCSLSTMSASNSTPGHTPIENHNSKRHMHPSVHSSTIYNSQDTWKQPRCPSTDEWMKNMW